VANANSNQSDLGYLFCPMFRSVDCKWMAIAAFYDQIATAALRVGQILTKKDFLTTGICCYINAGSIVELTDIGEHVVMVTQPAPQAPQGVRNGAGPRLVRGR
jgi:hypothetical protein